MFAQAARSYFSAYFRPYFAGLALLALLLPAALPVQASASDTVLPDGAVGVNAQWEMGKSKVWWIELQSVGGALISDGINRENDSMIRQGMNELDFGFAHQNAVTGEFTGTANGQTGPEFHSTSLFVEAAARATLLLQEYHPATYQNDTAFYQSKVSVYKKSLSAAGKWLTDPKIAATGQAYNAPFTHRRYLLAAALAQVGALTGSALLLSDADAYAAAGLARQLHSGTETVALSSSDNMTVNLNGVNPEEGGYDVNYQALGILYALRYYPYCRSDSLKARLRPMALAGLNWEQPWIAEDGVATTTGSTRVGIERNRDGSLKTPDYSAILASFENGYWLLQMPAFAVSAVRVEENGAPVMADSIDANGAEGASNIACDSGKTTVWSIADQATGADLIAAGISREDPALIASGCSLLDWGCAKLTTGSGQFRGAQSWYYGDAAFLEAAGRAALLLRRYAPATYTLSGSDASFYVAEIARWQSVGHLLAEFLASPAVQGQKEPEIAQSPARLSCVADALLTEGVLSDDTALRYASLPYLAAALRLQKTTGEFPEGGVADMNYQAITTLYLARLESLDQNSDPVNSSSDPVAAALTGSVLWENLWINPSGDGSMSGPVASGGSPARHTIAAAFLNAGEVTNNAAASADAFRLDAYEICSTLPLCSEQFRLTLGH